MSEKSKKSYWVYALQSEQVRYGKRGQKLPGLIYIGMTTDPKRRVREHNGLYANGLPGNPKGGRYTSKHRYWQLRALWGPYHTRSEALKAEYALKHGKRGKARLCWSKKDSVHCRGLGVDDPRIKEINMYLCKLRSV